jgi:hypothetical protein
MVFAYTIRGDDKISAQQLMNRCRAEAKPEKAPNLTLFPSSLKFHTQQ